MADPSERDWRTSATVCPCHASQVNELRCGNSYHKPRLSGSMRNADYLLTKQVYTSPTPGRPPIASPGLIEACMGTYPWGPHGPQSSPHEVMPNPTAPSAPVPDFGGGNYYPTTPSYGGGYAGGATGGGGYAGSAGYSGGAGFFGFLVKFPVSVIILALLWIPTICLYPLTFLSGAAAGLI